MSKNTRNSFVFPMNQVIGPEGPQGIQGVTGPQGNIGQTGPQGIKGDTGSQGIKGDIGSQGPIGPTGPSNGILNNIYLPTSSATPLGNIYKNNVSWMSDYGTNNLFLGNNTGNFTLTSQNNIGIGLNSLSSSTSGGNNVGVGPRTLTSITDEQYNVAIGSFCGNTSTGNSNIMIGFRCFQNASGDSNIGIGHLCGQVATTCTGNTVTGYTTGEDITTGSYNTLYGYSCGNNITIGAGNVFIGSNAGTNVTTTSNNIMISNPGVVGDNAYIKIGESGIHTRSYIGGIRGVTTTNANAINVVIDSAGQLGTASSTRDTKENIIGVDEESNRIKVNSLQPRMFDFKNCHGEYKQYGLIYDEVEAIAPELLAKNDDGSPLTLYYQHLPIMLLTEIQRLNRKIIELENKIL